MKKFFILLVCLAVALGASAKFRWGPTVGVNFEKFSWRQNLMGNSMLVGGNVGVMGEVMIPGIGFGFDFALKYLNHGGRVNFSDKPIWSSDGIKDTDLRMQVIQVPVNVRFKWTRMNGLENTFAPFVFGGPEFNFNVATTDCAAVKSRAATVGLTVGLGIELFRRYQITGSYVWDMTDDMMVRKLNDFHGRLEGWKVDFAVLF